MKKRFRTTIVAAGPMHAVPIPFDPAAVFGKVRAPVKVTLGGHSYRSTISTMGGTPWVPLRRSNREAAGLDGGETLTVTVELDTEARVVEVPPDLRRALAATSGALARWQELSYSHQREHVDAIVSAKQPATRARRIERAVAMVAARAPRARRASAAPPRPPRR